MALFCAASRFIFSIEVSLSCPLSGLLRDFVSLSLEIAVHWFSLPFMFSNYCCFVCPYIVRDGNGYYNETLFFFLFDVVFESSYWGMYATFNLCESSSPTFLDTYNMAMSSPGCKSMCIIINCHVIWSICLSSSLVHLKHFSTILQGTLLICLFLCWDFCCRVWFSFVSGTLLFFVFFHLHSFNGVHFIYFQVLVIFLFSECFEPLFKKVMEDGRDCDSNCEWPALNGP